MRYFNRVCAVEISPDIRIEGLKIKFEIKKNIEPDQNYFKLDIYNLSEYTRNRITTDIDGLVRIQAGYSENEGLVEICQGNISNVSRRLEKPDSITTIHCKDGFKAIRRNLISLSFQENTPLYSIIDTIVNKLNLPVRFADYDKNALLKGGFSFLGYLKDAMDILSQHFKFTWSIQNGQVQILKNDGSTGKQIVFLSNKTGLINDPEELLENKGLNESVRGLYSITALLQPQMEVGDLVAIESRELNGLYIVKELTHLGDTRGVEWYTVMRVVQNG